jgi:hypothetical protein
MCFEVFSTVASRVTLGSWWTHMQLLSGVRIDFKLALEVCNEVDVFNKFVCQSNLQH